MHFQDNQEQARRATGSLLFYLFLGTAGVVGMVVLIAAGLFAIATSLFFLDSAPGANTPYLRNTLLIVGAATSLAILLASAWKMSQLKRGGGEALARNLGGRLILPNTRDPIERRLLNVVEEIAIASMTARPLVYLLDGEPGVNAFAAGHTEHQAVLGITRGAAGLLPRDALQALVAHEFSHICNGDMRLNLKLIGHVHGIEFLQIAGNGLIRASMDRSKDSEGGFLPGVVTGAAILMVGSIGAFFATLIKAAVGRQREFLADAAAVQFTRNPQALIQVLLTVSGCSHGSVLRTPKAAIASHAYFSQGLDTWLSRLLATHPPIAERIKRIDPFYSGPLPEEAPFDEESVRNKVLLQARSEMAGFSGLTDRGASTSGGEEHAAVRACRIHARRMLDRLPHRLLAAARSTREAPALLCAMVLSRSGAKDRQVVADAMLEHCALPTHDLARELAMLLDEAPPASLLPLLDLAVTPLHGLEQDERENLRAALTGMMEANRRIELFEWMLDKVLERRLPLQVEWRDDALPSAPVPPALPEELGEARGRLAPLSSECALLLYALSHWGAPDNAEAASCFSAGARALLLGELELPAEKVTLRDVDEALSRLRRLPRLSRELFLNASVHAVPRSLGVPQTQGELLFGAAHALGCAPLPILPGQD